jgi:hypothetical protein
VILKEQLHHEGNHDALHFLTQFVEEPIKLVRPPQQ